MIGSRVLGSLPSSLFVCGLGVLEEQMKRFLAMLLAIMGAFRAAPPLQAAQSAKVNPGIDLDAISKGRDGDMQTLRIVYQINGGIDKEDTAKNHLAHMFRQREGVTTGELLDAVLSILNRHVPVSRQFGVNDPIIIESYQRQIRATGGNVHGLSSDGIFITIRANPLQRRTILSITQDARSPLLSWRIWLDELCRIEGFTQAILLDAVFDYFQNHHMLSFHKKRGRDTGKLITDAADPDQIDISVNPGRAVGGYGYQESVGSEMWFGEKFWTIAGAAARERLLGGDWPQGETLPGGLVHVTAAPECFTEQTDRAIMDRLRELVYKEARLVSGERGAREEAERKRFSKDLQNRTALARQVTEREEALFTATKEDSSRPILFVPPKPPYDPQLPIFGFGFKMAWMAVATDDVAEVTRFLALQDARWLPWSSAVEMAYDGKVIGVTPAVDGWVLVFGEKLFDWHPDNDIVAKCSRRFGEAQFFLTHRVSDGHHWSRWINGETVRSMTHFDGVEQIGEAAGIDEIIMLPLHSDNDWIAVDEQDVMRVANEWSVDPSVLGYREIAESHILVGNLP